MLEEPILAVPEEGQEEVGGDRVGMFERQDAPATMEALKCGCKAIQNNNKITFQPLVLWRYAWQCCHRTEHSKQQPIILRLPIGPRTGYQNIPISPQPLNTIAMLFPPHQVRHL